MRSMRFDVITLFPELFEPFLKCGVTRRAYQSGLVNVHLNSLREFAEGNYRRVDDRPYGGGPGMVMMAEPLAKCIEQISLERQKKVPVVLFSPMGQPLTHSLVSKWASSEGAILICGRYEGVDQRFIDSCVDHQISLGDFVLSGGEIAAMALLDSVARLQPGVLGDQESHQFDSFNHAIDGLLDCPHYTRSEEWRGITVPEELMSGNHARIDRWRRDKRVLLTLRFRPELIDVARADGRLSMDDEKTIHRYLSEQ